MKEEISAAVLFLTRLIAKNQELTEERVQALNQTLNFILMERFKGHWFPEKPSKGQAYRCIRVNGSERYDPVLQEAAEKCGLKYSDLKLPPEFTLWVDPHEVCCRFGEHKGSYCTIASFKNGNKENFVDKISINELEQKTAEILKKAAAQEMQKRKRSPRKPPSPHKNGFNHSFTSHQNILQQLPALPSKQNYQTPLFPTPVPPFRRSPLPSHLFNYNMSSPQAMNPFYPHMQHSNFSPSSLKFPSGYNSQTHAMNGMSPTSSSVRYVPNGSALQAMKGHTSGAIRYPQNGTIKNDRFHWVNRKAEME